MTKCDKNEVMKAETSRHLFNSRNNGEAFIAWSIRLQLQVSKQDEYRNTEEI